MNRAKGIIAKRESRGYQLERKRYSANRNENSVEFFKKNLSDSLTFFGNQMGLCMFV
jgi:hypothetical protein